jgi:xylose isomerase
MIESETLSGPLEKRYAGWTADLGSAILAGEETLESLEAKAAAGDIDPTPVSGEQELLENRVNRVIWSTGS